MSSSPVPLKTRRVEQRCTLNLSRTEMFSRWCGVVVRRGGCQLRCRPRHLTMVQNYVVRRQKPSCSTHLAVLAGFDFVIKLINIYCVIFICLLYRELAPQRIQPTEGLNEMQLPVITQWQYERCTCASDPVYDFVNIGQSNTATSVSVRIASL
ncbi:uncharacterized protein TNCV_3953961 [Trichonephila clavipes]|nr:uncharacterized protein TNCV_3953961 [Trichonephila clavipes]